jgi:magnesium transporter
VGIYGMNFEYMPELKKKYGYATVLIVMAISAILMFLYFVKKGWLKKSDYHLDNE